MEYKIQICLITFVIIFFILYIDSKFNNKKNIIKTKYVFKVAVIFAIYMYILLTFFMNSDGKENITKACKYIDTNIGHIKSQYAF